MDSLSHPFPSDAERPFNRNKKHGRVVKVDRKIWDDPEFRSLSPRAQWVYFWRITQVDRNIFSQHAMKRDGGFSADEAEAVVAELRETRYAAIVMDRGQREWVPLEDRMAIFRRDGFKCLHCGTKKRLTIDHIIPVALGGPNERSNYQTLCHSCNSRKGIKVEVR